MMKVFVFRNISFKKYKFVYIYKKIHFYLQGDNRSESGV